MATWRFGDIDTRIVNPAMVAFKERVVALPPFWTAFAFVCLVSLPQAFLALPIAAAPFGAIGGVAVVGALGLVNVVTVMAVAEATARSPATRYQSALLAGTVREFLGSRAALLVTGAQAITFFLALVASALGLSLTLDAETGLPAVVWLVLLAVAVFALVSRATLGLGVLIALGGANVAVILLIAIAMVFDGRAKHLRGPEGGIEDLGSNEWAGLLGVALISFFGHALVGQSARIVLPRDPSGRSLVRGSMAGMLALTALLCGWILVVDTDLWPADLDGQRGTVLVELERVGGPWVTTLGTVLVVTLPGLTALRCATVLTGLVRERLPQSWIATERGTSIVGAETRRWFAVNAPAFAGFALVATMLLTGQGSFTMVLGAAGVLGVAVFAGVVPPLLLLASRRKGLSPGVEGARLLDQSPIVLALVGLFLGIILLHSLLLWTNVGERLAGLLAAAAVVLAAVPAWRVARQRRLVVALLAPVAGTGDQASIEAALGGAVELQIWALQGARDGSLVPMPAAVTVSDGQGVRHVDVNPNQAEVLEVQGERCLVTVRSRPDPADDQEALHVPTALSSSTS